MPERCPKCKDEDLFALVDPMEEIWGLDPDEFEEDGRVWHCGNCGWYEEATEDEIIDEISANLDWIMNRVAGGEFI